MEMINWNFEKNTYILTYIFGLNFDYKSDFHFYEFMSAFFREMALCQSRALIKLVFLFSDWSFDEVCCFGYLGPVSSSSESHDSMSWSSYYFSSSFSSPLLKLDPLSFSSSPSIFAILKKSSVALLKSV